jgi:hypothetical protein
MNTEKKKEEFLAHHRPSTERSRSPRAANEE